MNPQGSEVSLSDEPGKANHSALLRIDIFDECLAEAEGCFSFGDFSLDKQRKVTRPFNDTYYFSFTVECFCNPFMVSIRLEAPRTAAAPS